MYIQDSGRILRDLNKGLHDFWGSNHKFQYAFFCAGIIY